ncbi:MAG: ChbG/HpnK family deacetylase [Nitrospirota bacterium]
MKSNNSGVIINADDFGITSGVNRAIFELVDAGVLTSTSVMSNMPDFEEILNLKNRIGIGMHFNLTVGRPVTEPQKVRSLINEEGNFPGLSQLIQRIKQRRISPQETEIELDAQIRRLADTGINPDHINSHESLIKYPFFSAIIRRLALKCGIRAVRTYTPRKFDYHRLLSPRKILISIYLEFQKAIWKANGFTMADRYDSLIEPELNYEKAFHKLKDIFQSLRPGVLEIGVHPGYCDEGEEFLGEYIFEREIELKSLMSPEFRDVVKHSNVKMITFKEIGN